jgi:DsbC/DsbD-like thiol-disulfide interchange protein
LTRLDETEGNQKKPAADKPVKAKIYTYFNKLPRGGRCPVAIEVTIADGWHINANPASADYLIPTEVRVKSPQKVKLTKIKYPKHEEHVIAGEEKPLFVYGRKVLIYGVLEVDPAEEAGEAEVNVEIRYQACKGDSCEPPNQVRLTGKLKIAQDESELQKVNEAQFPQ